MQRGVTYMLAAVLLLGSCGGGGHEAPNQPDSRSLTLTGPSEALSWQQTAFTVQVSANFAYDVTFQEEWITEDPDRRSTEFIRYFVAQENPNNWERSAEIRFTDHNDRYYSKVVTVTQGPNAAAKVSLSIVDKDATAQTKALLANLWTLPDRGWMFGHHDDLWYGRFWYGDTGGSDTKAVCGDYPAVFSVDFADVMCNPSSSEMSIRRRVILEARERGEVIMACIHVNNPKTGGDSWDNSSDQVVKEILTEGTDTRAKYITWLDRLASFANNLKDARGDLIPVLFRMYHEHTQGWSWWGSSCTTESDFIAFWRFTVQYLRDTKGVHNFLYAVSPQMDQIYPSALGRILYRWPGDDWVDYIGMDCYHGTWDDAFKANLEALDKASQNKRKPCGVTETGKEAFLETDFWTRHILSPLEGHRVSMVTLWRNKYVGSNTEDTHYFSVFPGHPSEDDFRALYDAERSLFSRDLPDMYTMPAGFEIK